MSANYSFLVQNVVATVQSLKQALPSADRPSELQQAHLNLKSLLDKLWELDVDAPEPTGQRALLSEAVAMAQNIADHVINLPESSGLALQLTELDEALDVAREAGYNAPDPGNLPWYEGDEPDDGTGF